jgi:hypothetical protein
MDTDFPTTEVEERFEIDNPALIIANAPTKAPSPMPPIRKR